MRTSEFRDPEVENPPVIEDDTLPATKPSEDTRSMLERLVDDDEAERALQKIDTMTAILEKLRIAAIKATFPSDWIIHTSKDPDGNIIRQVGYLQDCGAERAGKVWGIEVGSPKVTFEKFEDGTFCYHMEAEAYAKVTKERIDRVDGSRWSGDRFFAKQVGPDEKVDPTDVRKSAWANLHGRAVRSLAGLGGVPLEMLRKAGLDVSRVVNIGYETGAKGGASTGASVGASGDLTIPWGNAKGTKVTELSEKDLEFYHGAYTRDVDDPKKERFRANNQKMLAALTAEKERRSRSREQEDAGGSETKETRGARLTKANARIREALGKNHAKSISPFLAYLTAELGLESKQSISELTDEDLEKLSEAGDETLADYVGAFLDQQGG